jgi:hypothetical protein
VQGVGKTKKVMVAHEKQGKNNVRG